jgi:ankyrin repeat protein
MLLQAGAAPDTLDILNNCALAVAAANGHLETVRTLLRYGSNIECGSEYNRSALLMACEKGHVEVVDFLLDNGAKINNAASGGENALLKALKNRHIALALRLLQRGAEYDVKDKDGNTGWSKATEALKTGTEPGKVKITSATVTENGKVKLTWTSAGEDVYYSIYCSPKKNKYEYSVGWTPELSAEVPTYGNAYIKVYAYGLVYEEDGSRRIDICPETDVYDIVKIKK